MFTDTHCHLLSEYYEDINQILQDATKQGVNRFINAAYDETSIIEVVSLAKTLSGVYGVIGIHPSEAKRYEELDFSIVINNLNNKNIIAVGEIGLDYHYGKEYAEEQKLLFRRQLEIASKYHLPVVVHSRDATADTISILHEYFVKGVIHSFSGSYETALEYISMGFVLGINGCITFKNNHLIEVIKKIGLEHIVLETDCPYLTPQPFRGQTNYPSNILLIAKYLAKNLNVSLSQIAKILDENTHRIFDI